MASTHFDVLIVGAGLSGIDAAYRIQTDCPGKTYAVLEGRSAMGGTWDLFRYPGIRSDSDMFTLGYPFRPWTAAKSIADGASILRYIHETAVQFGIDQHIRYDHLVSSAAWSTEDARWTVDIDVAGELCAYTCNFLYVCSGYYSYAGGFDPQLPGMQSFAGQVVHPQEWPEDLDYAGKRVVVIGSGATAITLLPAMADDTTHITMLQRSPGYIATLPSKDTVADLLRRVLPAQTAHSLVRWKNVTVSQGFYQFCRRAPKAATRLLQAGVRRQVGDAIDIDPHFTPAYRPWDQRLCMVPDGDLFEKLTSGKASIVTDRIVTITPTGIELASGRHIEADIIVTATGLEMLAIGGISLSVDGMDVDVANELVYKGLMFADVPNFAWCVGYTNASWTLRADLSSQYVCRLINYLDEHQMDFGFPHSHDRDMDTRSVLDLDAGYVRRAADRLPKQGTQAPWQLRQNYFRDSVTMRWSRVDQSMVFGRATAPRHQPETSTLAGI